ncbi:MAG: DUF4349 domain-containing protein [Pseudomonadota bacterium]|nr:DUF4349 domain-containing protein [Pseudomonadota bacterium]
MRTILLVLLVMLAACAKRYAASEEMAGGERYEADGYGSGSGSSAPTTRSSAGGPPPPAPPPSGRPSSMSPPAMKPAVDAPASVPDVAAAVTPAAARMVHYQGYAELRVGKQQEATDALIALATEAGGGLEQQYGATIVLRVPVAKFREVFDAVLKVGDVTRKSIAAEDVTEAFSAVELRLSTAKARRDRLVTLLAQSRDENEKLALVREIQEVTEEIDRLEQSVRTLQRLADFSRITVQLQQRPALTWQGGAPESAAFAWIRSLSPFDVESSIRALGGKKLELELPEGFVPLDAKGRFIVESAEGARVWATRLVNDPVGDTPFWTDALARRLTSEFAEGKPVSVGDWQGLRLLDRSDKPYVWVVLVRASGNDLDLVQIFYPSVAAEERHAPAVRAALGQGGAS